MIKLPTVSQRLPVGRECRDGPDLDPIVDRDFNSQVTTNAQTINRKPATAKANAADVFGTSASITSEEPKDSGIKIRIGTARLRIAFCPMSRKVCELNAVMLRLNANQVPQKTPITNANKMIVENCASFSFIPRSWHPP